MSTASVSLPAPTDRPVWLPQKFETAEAMAKSYVELEKMVGTQKAPEPVTPPVTSAPPTEPQAPTSLQVPTPPPGIDLGKYSTEYDTKGSLSEDSYKELEKQGHTKAVVDQFIAGQLAQRQLIQAEVFKEVGGQDEYGKLVTWATQGLSPAEKEAYNKATSSGDIATIKLAVAGLKARFTTAHGSDPKLLGGSAGTTGPQPFRSTAEMRTAMSDPRYKTDPAYQQEVYARMGVS